MSGAREENPFEDPKIAEQWIGAVEAEKHWIRDNEIYPLLRVWAESLKFETVLEIGAGQGVCAPHVGRDGKAAYTGVEPSRPLLARAKELYVAPNHSFVLGSAYELSIESESQDAAFSVMVWFHLKDIRAASEELARVLTPGGHFLIVTPDPDSYDEWRSYFKIEYEDEARFEGWVNIPGHPLDKNVFYTHSKTEMIEALEAGGLSIDSYEKIGWIEDRKKNLMIVIQGKKN